jgi:hypothetical protein
MSPDFSIYLILLAAVWSLVRFSLSKLNIRNLHGDIMRPAYEADNLTVIREPMVLKTW